MDDVHKADEEKVASFTNRESRGGRKKNEENTPLTKTAVSD